MIDLSAKDFANWCNSLASEEQAKSGSLSPELIKNLFSVKMEGSAPRGLQVAPRNVHTLTPVLINHLKDDNLRKYDLEAKMQKLSQRDCLSNQLPVTRSAFGRSLSSELKHSKRVHSFSSNKPEFPEELQTKQALFKGIEHLQ